MVDVADVRVKLTADTNGVRKGFSDIIKQLKTYEDTFTKVMSETAAQNYRNTLSITKALENIQRTSRVAHTQIQKDTQNTLSAMKKLQLQFNQTYRTLFNIKTIALVTFGGMVKGISDAVGEAERMKASLEVITGGQGDIAFNALSSFAQRTNLTTAEAVKQYTQLRAVGLEPTIDDMERLLDLTNAFGGSTAVFQRITKALGDIQAKGKLMGEEVRQLTNIGIPIKQILLEAGVLTENMINDIGRANISTQKTFSALMAYINTNFKGITNEIMKTWAGTVERMRDTWWRWTRVLGENGFIDSLKDALDNMMNSGSFSSSLFLQSLESISSIMKSIVTTITNSNIEGVLIVIAPILEVIDSMLKTIAASIMIVTTGLENLAESMVSGVINFAAYQKILFTDGLDAAEAYAKRSKEIGEHFDKINNYMQGKELLGKLEELYAGIGDIGTSDTTDKIMKSSRALEEMLSNLSKGLDANPETMFSELNKQINAAVQDSIPKSEKLRSELNEFKKTYEDFYTKDGFNDTILNGYKEAISKATNDTQLKDATRNLKLYQEAVNKQQSGYSTAVKAKQLEIDKQIAREERGRLKTADQIDAKYNELVHPIDKLKSGSQRWAEHQKVVLERLQKTGKVSQEFFKEYNEKLDLIINKTNQGWIQGMADGFAEMGVQMQESYTLWKSFASNITGALTDAFTEFFDKGKTDWGNFLQTVRQMIIKTLVQQAIVGPLAESMSSVLGSFVKTGFSSYFGASGSSTAYDTGDNDILGNKSPVSIEPFHPSSINASGGMVTEPVYGYGMRTGDSYLMGEAGNEAIIPLNKMGSGSSGGSNTTVNIYGGDENTRVQQKQGRNGPEIDIILDQKIAQLASKNGSAFAKSLKATYGMQQRRV